MSYVIPTEEISLSEQIRMRKTAIEKGFERAEVIWNMSRSNLEAREAHYVNDFLTPAAVAVVGLSGWLTMPLAVAATYYDVFASSVPAAVTPTCPTNQVWVFYKVNMLELAGPDPVAALRFRVGAAANLRAQFDLEGICGKLVSDGYFNQPVTYENPEICQAQVQCRVVTGAGARVRLGCFIIEPLQNTVI